MKRLLGLVVAFLLAVPAAPVGAQGVYTAAQQGALVIGLTQKGDDLWLYFASGGRWTHPAFAPTFTYGVVGKGKCRVSKNGNSIACTAQGKVHFLPLEDFSFDPTLAKATLEMSKGPRASVTWTGVGPVTNEQWSKPPGGKRPTTGVAVAQYRSAVADGRFLGVEMVQEDMAILYQDAGAVAQYGARFSSDGRSMTVRYELPIRHARWVR